MVTLHSTDFRENIIHIINQLLEKTLSEYLNNENNEIQSELFEAIRYSVLNGGKRLRPLLVYAVGKMIALPLVKLNAAAMAVEFIHCYSLIHDDLPAMDNDCLRRGKATCHIAFDEATAILAGDALQTLAFEVLCDPHLNPVSDKQKLAMITILAKAAGANGMVEGQALDMASIKTLSVEALSMLHQKKTGALIKASVQMASVAAEFPREIYDQLSLLAEYVGLAFQLQDDIMDVEGSSSVIGKSTGKDAALNKQSFPALIGIEQTKKHADDLYRKAISILDDLSNVSHLNLNVYYLRELLEFFIYRRY